MLKVIKIFILILIIFLAGCSQNQDARKTVATVGDQKINFRDFYESFMLQPHFRPNVTLKEARIQHAEYLIDRRILAMAALEDGIDKEEEIKARRRYIQHQEILKYFYQKEVMDKIPTSTQDLWKEYKLSNLQVKLRHLFAESREEAQKLYDRLQAGETFAALAPEVFRDSTLAKNGGDLGFVPVTQLDPFLVDSISNMQIGSYSKPLKSSFGYHIFKVEDVKQSVFLSEDEFKQQQENLEGALKQRKAKVKSAEFVVNTLKGKSVTLISRTLKELLSVNKSHISIRRSEIPVPFPAVTDEEINAIIKNAPHLLEELLAEFHGGAWTVGDFLKKLLEMPPLRRPVITGYKAITRNIIDMVRDELLLKEAYARGLNKTVKVKLNVGKWYRELLADEFHKRILVAGYKKLDPLKWRQRKMIYQNLKTITVSSIDTVNLFKDIKKSQLNKKVQPLKIQFKNAYTW